MKPSPVHNPSPARARILLVDDHPILRDGLSRLINQEPDIIVCGQAATFAEALRLATTLRPDLAIVDLTLDDANGIDLIKILRGRLPRMPVLVLSMHKEGLYAERSMRAGARGYLIKQEAPETVLFAIRKVLSGKLYLSEALSDRLLDSLSEGIKPSNMNPVSRLSDRELEIFELIGRGRGTRQVADDLCLSVKTVETHREHIKEKLQLHSATELVQSAFEWVKSESAD